MEFTMNYYENIGPAWPGFGFRIKCPFRIKFLPWSTSTSREDQDPEERYEGGFSHVFTALKEKVRP